MESACPPDLTALLLAWSDGDRVALDALIPLLHEELLATAHRYMARENPAHTLESGALVNEAYLRIVDIGRVDWRDRAHFLAVSARIMRHILVDWARAKKGQKRGGDVTVIEWNDADHPVQPSYDLIDLDQMLNSLAANDSRRAKVVELRIFGGLTIAETAIALGISPDTVTRDWNFAKAWLARELSRPRPEEAGT